MNLRLLVTRLKQLKLNKKEALGTEDKKKIKKKDSEEIKKY